MHSPPRPAASYRPVIDRALRLLDRLDGAATPLPPAEGVGGDAGRTPPGVGSALGPCRLEAELGRGTSGVVYRADHLKLGIPVAVKVLHPEVMGRSAGVRDALRHEAMLLAQLNHPNVIRLWDFDHDGRWPYLVTEYVTGSTLAGRIAQVGRLPQDWALSIARQAARGLAAAAKVGVTHRDVKPANLLTAADGTVKIADLGLAVATGRQDGRQTPLPGGLAGTPAYMSPEQAQGLPTDHRSDIYSLGCTLYHALTGRMPFDGRTPWQLILQHVQQAPVPPADVVPGLETSANALVLRMMAKEPADRFADYGELLAAFDAALG